MVYLKQTFTAQFRQNRENPSGRVRI